MAQMHSFIYIILAHLHVMNIQMMNASNAMESFFMISSVMKIFTNHWVIKSIYLIFISVYEDVWFCNVQVSYGMCVLNTRGFVNRRFAVKTRSTAAHRTLIAMLHSRSAFKVSTCRSFLGGRACWLRNSTYEPYRAPVGCQSVRTTRHVV